MIPRLRTDRSRSVGAALVLFAVNLFVCGRLLHTRYLDQLPSIEGAFIALEKYIQAHWPGYDWFPLWCGGMPFTRVYQPALHYTAAAVASVAGWDVALAYHAVTAITYSLGGVTFYLLARALTRHIVASFLGGLLFSLFSPSVLFVPSIRADAGGLLHARRLQAMVGYGEGPNITGLTLAMLALALVHRALVKKTPLATCVAALAVAAVAATNWPATMALSMALLCYLIALSARDLAPAFGRLTVIGMLALGFASPFAPPSTIFETFAQANAMTDGPTPGSGRWISLGLMILALIALRILLAWRQTPFALRFPLIWFLFTNWIVMTAALTGVRMIPQPMRFHVAMEVPFALAIAVCGLWIARRWPSIARPAVAVLLILCCGQAWNYRRYARTLIRSLDIEKTSEYQMAEWCQAHMRGQRIFTAGTFGFWLNAFTSTPQVSGFFDQSITNFSDRIAAYVVSAGYMSDRESADYSLLWLKAWAADAIQLGGPGTADVYKDFQFPNRFRNLLPVVWSRGDDYVYRVPERTEGLARVVRRGDVMSHRPANGIDVAELRPFVTALDDASLPQSHFQWQSANSARITGLLAPDQVYSIAINYDPGWTASRAGKPVPLHADGMGMIVAEPGCTGGCEIEIRWSQRWEKPFVISVFLLALACSAGWCLLSRYRGIPGIDRPAARPA